MADTTTQPPHSEKEILARVISVFADLDLGKSPRSTVKSLPLFRMAWNKDEPVVTRLGWRYLVVIHSRDSFVVDALSTGDSGFRFLFRRGAGEAWQQAIQRLNRRAQVKARSDEPRCLDVPAVHRSYIWLASSTGGDLLINIHDHGQVSQRARLRNLQEVQREAQLALEGKVQAFARMKEAVESRS